MFPPWSSNLRFLFWRLRMARPGCRPSRRTLQRRILDEKKRLRASGVDPFALHAVCVLLRRSEHSPAACRARKVLERFS